MVINISNNVSNRTPVETNRRVKATIKSDSTIQRTPAEEQAIQASRFQNDGGFIDRRQTPDRRKEDRKPLVDTRRAGDRRRGKSLDVQV